MGKITTCCCFIVVIIILIIVIYVAFGGFEGFIDALQQQFNSTAMESLSLFNKS